MEQYQKLRLQEFNSFDIERILKENIQTLNEENKNIMDFVEKNKEEFPKDVIASFAGSASNNAAEILRILSLTHHTDNIYEFFSGGPLFRKDRDAK